MKQSVRTGLLLTSALLMTFGAFGYALVLLPDLHGDLVEIGVRPTVLGATVRQLYFSAIAMFGFALMVSAAALQAMRGLALARVPLGVVALVNTIFGVMSFSETHSPHHLGPLLAGVLLGVALVIRTQDGNR
jgi:hypothetical protein